MANNGIIFRRDRYYLLNPYKKKDYKRKMKEIKKLFK